MRSGDHGRGRCSTHPVKFEDALGNGPRIDALRSGHRQDLSCHLVNALGGKAWIGSGWCVAHESAAASPGDNEAFLLKGGISLLNGTEVDPQRDGDLAHSRHLVAGTKSTGADGGEELLAQ